MDDFVSSKKNWLSSRWQKRVAKFCPKFVGSFKLFVVVKNNLVVGVDGEFRRWTTVNLDQVRVYKVRENSERSQMSNANSQLPLSRESAGGYSY